MVIQLENGYTKLANEWLDIFCCTSLSDREWRVLHTILRKTYGYNKKMDAISYQQFEKYTHIKARHLTIIIKKLEGKKMILVDRTGYITRYTLNKVSPEWGIPQTGEESIPQTGEESIPHLGEYKRKKERKTIRNFVASNKKPMYQEQTIELDESGEEIQSPRKKTTFGRYPGKIAKAYCELTGKRSASRQLPSAKELMQICQEDFPGKSMEEWYGEIIKRMQKLKEQYDKNDIKDWNLSKLAEHWELKKEEIKKDVADRRIL